MPNYIYGTILTNCAASSNNHSEPIAAVWPLQKLTANNYVYSCVSAEAIRFALRYRFQLEHLSVNRTYDPSLNRFVYADESRQCWNAGVHFIDDDIMGFMNLDSAKTESNDGTTPELRSRKTLLKAPPKPQSVKRQGPLSVGRAISLRPYRGDLTFNTTVSNFEDSAALYRFEMHMTEYQYTFMLAIDEVVDKQNILHLLDAIADPPPVGGSHARFYYDFSPASIVLRLTKDNSARIQNCFELSNGDTAISLGKLLHKLEDGDIAANELILGGEITKSDEGAKAISLGTASSGGIKAAISTMKDRVTALYSIKTPSN